MEPLYPWLLLIAGLLVGALIGGAAMLTIERRSRGSEHDVRQVRRELDAYRDDVAQHYAETAKRVNQLTHAYKDVYDHLEGGAYRLVGEEELRRRLDDAAPRPVTLEGIGQRSLQRPEDPTPAPSRPRVDPERPPAGGDRGPTEPAAGATATEAAAAAPGAAPAAPRSFLGVRRSRSAAHDEADPVHGPAPTATGDPPRVPVIPSAGDAEAATAGERADPFAPDRDPVGRPVEGPDAANDGDGADRAAPGPDPAEANEEVRGRL